MTPLFTGRGPRLALALFAVTALSVQACGSDDDDTTNATGGSSSSGRGGAAGKSGRGGASGHAGSGGTAGSGNHAGGGGKGGASNAGRGGTTAANGGEAGTPSGGAPSGGAPHESGGEAGATAGGAAGEGAGAGGQGGEAGGGVETVPVSIHFEARVGAEPFACSTSYTSLGTNASTATPLDFRFYVYDLALLPASGPAVPVTLTPDGTFQSSRLALVDFEDATGTCNGTPGTHTSVQGTVPAASYHGLSFKVGVPFDLDHQDQSTAAAPLDDPTLWWSWAAGYRFMRIDFQPAATDTSPFFFHLGTTDCTGSNPDSGQITSCARPDEVTVSLPDFVPGTSKVVIDYATLVADVNLEVNTDATAPGCMSETADPECASTFPKLGLDVTTGSPSGTAQTVFSVE